MSLTIIQLNLKAFEAVKMKLMELIVGMFYDFMLTSGK